MKIPLSSLNPLNSKIFESLSSAQSLVSGALSQIGAGFVRPGKFKRPGGPTLLLVPGAFCTPSVMNRLGFELEKYGADVFVTHPYPFKYGVLANVGRLEKAVPEFVDDMVELREKYGVEKVWIVGHSCGGILPLLAADRLKADKRAVPEIAGVITLAAPFMGTPIAEYLKHIFPVCKDLARDAPILNKLIKNLNMVKRALIAGRDSLVPRYSQDIEVEDKICLSDFQHMDFIVGSPEKIKKTAELTVEAIPELAKKKAIIPPAATANRLLPPAVKSFIELFGPLQDPDEVGELDLDLGDVVVPLLKILKLYFRAEVRGLENIPSGQALLVGNHNGGITFMEPFMLGMEWYKWTQGKDALYWLGHDVMMSLPVLSNLLMKLGGVRASHETAGKVFEMGRKVAVFPGGNYEAFRPFKERYKVDFGGKKGFIRLALRHGTPIVPVLCLGGHETFFILHRGEKLAELTGAKKWLRSESFPIFIGLPYGLGIGPIFHWPLPAKCLVEVGQPISLAGYSPKDAGDPEVLQDLYDMVQGRLQDMMDRRVSERRFPVLG